MSSYKITHSDELYHHGILGQKWGVRRFQNPDGSLTEEGRKRYNFSTSRRNTASRFIGEARSGNNVRPRDVRRNMDRMTDAELQKAINRINMQQQVRSMDKNAIDKGLKALKSFTAAAGTIIASKVMYDKMSNLVEGALGDILFKAFGL